MTRYNLILASGSNRMAIGIVPPTGNALTKGPKEISISKRKERKAKARRTHFTAQCNPVLHLSFPKSFDHDALAFLRVVLSRARNQSHFCRAGEVRSQCPCSMNCSFKSVGDRSKFRDDRRREGSGNGDRNRVSVRPSSKLLPPFRRLNRSLPCAPTTNRASIILVIILFPTSLANIPARSKRLPQNLERRLPPPTFLSSSRSSIGTFSSRSPSHAIQRVPHA